MIRDFIKDNYGSRKGLLYYQWDGFLNRVGVYQHKIPAEPKVERVVFVCQGNICRSALAEAVFRQNSSLDAASLGLDTTSGKPADKRMIEIAKDKANIDLTDHRTTSLKDYEAKTGDLMVCMELRQIKQLRRLGFEHPCVLLGAFGKTKLPRINDPYCANERFMRKTVDDIVYHAICLADSLQG